MDDLAGLVAAVRGVLPKGALERITQQRLHRACDIAESLDVGSCCLMSFIGDALDAAVDVGWLALNPLEERVVTQ
jgi:hypothetical protein